MSDLQSLILAVLQGLASSTVFVLALFIGFCVVFGFTKLKRTGWRWVDGCEEPG